MADGSSGIGEDKAKKAAAFTGENDSGGARSRLRDFFLLSHRDLRDWICIGLALITLQVFLPVYTFDFLNYDDTGYVTNNLQVTSGLSLHNLAWAFGTLHADVSYWHPLTWISHQMDCQLFGLRPGAHHLTNLMFHIGAGVLLFLFLERSTGSIYRSALVASFFSLHPLHVESVAWISERKDVLSGFFWMACLLSYARYASMPTPQRYLGVTILFAFGLMAKPSVVTLPLVLLLLDFWPLGRWRKCSSQEVWKRNWRLILEKIPWLIMSALVGVITILAQRDVGTMASLQAMPVSERVENALVVYSLYLWKTVWPVGLAPIYSRTGSWPMAGVLASTAILAGITIVTYRLRRKAPYLITGWVWFVVTLLPMIGIIQVGIQFMADRYTYISLIGIFLMLAWGVGDLSNQFRAARKPIVAACLVALIGAVFVTRHQLGFWESSFKLFTRAVEVVEGNWVGHHMLGLVFANEERFDEAEKHFEAAILIAPERFMVINEHRGDMHFRAGNFQSALDCYRTILAGNPDSSMANLRVAWIYAAAPDNAIRDGRRALFHAEWVWMNSLEADGRHLDALAAAYAENEQFDRAVETAERAWALARAAGATPKDLLERLELYRRGVPFRIHPESALASGNLNSNESSEP
jgi:protein O-mannosyl-transferase